MEKTIKLAAAATVKTSDVTRMINVQSLSSVTRTKNGRIASVTRKAAIIVGIVGKKISKKAK